MKSKFLKKCICVIISVVFVIACMPSAFAVQSPKEDEKYHPGRVLVSVTYGAPSFAEMLEGYEITNIRLLTPGSANHIVYLVEFSEKTYEIVLEAIEVLSKNPYVIVAEPDYIGEYLPVGDPIVIVPTTPTPTVSVPTVPEVTVPEVTTPEGTKYHPGRVLVSVTYGAPSFAEMLEGYEITSTRLLTPCSATQIVYLVEFSEKTYEIVLEAIEVLSKNPYVIAAEPDYIGEWCVEPDDKSQYLPVVDPTEPVIDVEDETVATVPTQTSTEPTDYVIGDADGDGELTVKDATTIQKYLAGLLSAQDINYTNANVRGNGAVSIQDATMIQKKLAGFANEW